MRPSASRYRFTSPGVIGCSLVVATAVTLRADSPEVSGIERAVSAPLQDVPSTFEAASEEIICGIRSLGLDESRLEDRLLHLVGLARASYARGSCRGANGQLMGLLALVDSSTQRGYITVDQRNGLVALVHHARDLLACSNTR